MIENLLFRVYLLISDFIVASLKASKNGQKITSFTVQFRSKNLIHFANLNSINIFPETSVRKYLLQRRRKLLSGGGAGGGGVLLNNFLREACCLGLVKCFETIIFIDIFGNSTIF